MTEKNDRSIPEREAQEAMPKALTLSELLAAGRKQSGYSLDRAAAATRITQPFIEALEKGDIDKLPSHVFVRGFLKSLAKLYGISSEELISAFERENVERKLGSPSTNVGQTAAPRDSLKSTLLPPLDRGTKEKVEHAGPEVNARSRRKGTVYVALGVAAIVVLMLMVRNYRSNPPDPKVAEPVVVAPSEPIPTSENEQQEASQESEANVTDVPATPDASSSPAVTTSQELRIIAKSPVRVRYKADEAQWVAKELNADTHVLQFQVGLQLMVYDASAVDIFFNGRSLGNLGGKGRIRRLNFQAADVSGATAKKP